VRAKSRSFDIQDMSAICVALHAYPRVSHRMMNE
jgi:hypothetical protein